MADAVLRELKPRCTLGTKRMKIGSESACYMRRPISGCLNLDEKQREKCFTHGIKYALLPARAVLGISTFL